MCLSLKDLTLNGDSLSARQPATTRTAARKNKASSTSTVRLVQVRLKDAGFDPGPIDGIGGVKTHAALAALQSDCAMVEDGPMASLSKDALPLASDGAANTARPAPLTTTNQGTKDYGKGKHSSRDAVMALQIHLREAGFDPGPIDGILGPRTRTAARNYQSSLR